LTRILITGASGFVGGNFAKHCLERGHEVVSIEHDERPVTTDKLLEIHDHINWCKGTLLDEGFVKRVVADYEVDTIAHFGALPIVRTGHRTTTPIFETNIMGTVNLLEAVKEQHLSGYKLGILYFGTDKEYGYAEDNKPYREDTPLSGLNVYDVSKACADLICQCYHHSFHIPMSIVRVCNIFGPADTNSRLIPNTIRNCLKGKPPVIFKDIYYVREFVYIGDVCDALQIILEKIGPKLAVYNVGSGIWMNQEACIQAILKFFPDIKPVYESPPDYTRIEIPYQRLDTSKIEKELGWKAKTTFDEGLRRTITWYRTAGRNE